MDEDRKAMEEAMGEPVQIPTPNDGNAYAVSVISRGVGGYVFGIFKRGTVCCTEVEKAAPLTSAEVEYVLKEFIAAMRAHPGTSPLDFDFKIRPHSRMLAEQKKFEALAKAVPISEAVH